MKADKQLIINKKITLGYNINQFFSETKYKIIFVPKFPTKNYYFKGKKKSKLMVGKNSFLMYFLIMNIKENILIWKDLIIKELHVKFLWNLLIRNIIFLLIDG